MPDPLLVLVPDMVGLADVPYATPRELTAAPPSEVTFPPVVALLEVIADAAVVVTVANTAGGASVLKVT